MGRRGRPLPGRAAAVRIAIIRNRIAPTRVATVGLASADRSATRGVLPNRSTHRHPAGHPAPSSGLAQGTTTPRRGQRAVRRLTWPQRGPTYPSVRRVPVPKEPCRGEHLLPPMASTAGVAGGARCAPCAHAQGEGVKTEADPMLGCSLFGWRPRRLRDQNGWFGRLYSIKETKPQPSRGVEWRVPVVSSW
jgi:hypothetical protein